MAFLAVANKIIVGKCMTRKRPWDLQANGDLCRIFAAYVQARGRHSIKGTWTKGHAKAHHIEFGKATHATCQGNDKADSLADKGLAQHLEGLAQLSGYYAAKHEKACGLALRPRS